MLVAENVDTKYVNVKKRKIHMENRFGYALEQMQLGKKVRRAGWNGKGMWITIGRGATIDADNFWNPHTKQHAIEQGGSAIVDDYIIMKTASGSICMGWLASQEDILSTDWEIA